MEWIEEYADSNEYKKIKFQVTCKERKNVLNYGFIDLNCKEYKMVREFTTDKYAAMIHIHCNNITFQELYKSKFYDLIKNMSI
ncbi:MAG: hypothetical protein M0P01_06840 [Treponema sp.]|nr:hypothetical protein [Treponema sp.]